MRRFLAIVLFAILPLQFSWAAVASYCEHETQGAGHFGHHEHDHCAAASASVEPSADDDAAADSAAGAMELDCGHCHGQCSAMPTLSATPPVMLAMAPPGAVANEAGSAHAPTRPERPQWPSLA